MTTWTHISARWRNVPPPAHEYDPVAAALAELELATEPQGRDALAYLRRVLGR